MHSEFQEVAALTAGRLVRGSPANQDDFLRAGGLEALQAFLGADWGETRRSAGVQAAAASALADAMTGNQAAKDAFFRRGEFRSFSCDLVQTNAAESSRAILRTAEARLWCQPVVYQEGSMMSSLLFSTI